PAPRDPAMAAGSRLLLASILLFVFATPAHAQLDEAIPGDPPIMRPVLAKVPASASRSSVANANCPQATCDTVWVGHSSSGPGGAFLGVGIGGLWDFDTDVAGTDSTQ